MKTKGNPYLHGFNLRKRANWISLVLFIFVTFNCLSQSNIPLGTWQIHPSYLEKGFLTGSATSIFSVSDHSLFYLNLNSKEINTLSVLDGLYDQSFSAAEYDPQSKQLVIAYPDGTVQLVGEKNIHTLSALRNNSQIQQKNINNIKIFEDIAYLPGDFGLTGIHIRERRFIFSYTNLGEGGSTLPAFDLAKDENAYYLATQSGLLKGDFSLNLNDFRNWTKVPSLSFPLLEIEKLGNKLFIVAQNGDLWMYDLENSQAEKILGLSQVKNLRLYGDRVYFQSQRVIYAISENGSWTLFYESEADDFSDYLITEQATFLHVAQMGIKEATGTIYAPNGPSSPINRFFPSTEGILGVPFFQDIKGNRFVADSSIISRLFNGKWTKLLDIEDITSFTQMGNELYFGSNTGLWKKSASNLEKVTLPNSDTNTPILALHTDSDNNTWIGLANSSSNLYKINSRGEVSVVNVPGMTFPYKILSDRSSNLWILQQNPSGNPRLQVYNEKTSLNRVLTSSPDNGNLPQWGILDMDLDGDQNLWLATENGVAYLPNVHTIQENSRLNALFPIFQGRTLMTGISVRNIKVAPDQSKWLGTEREGLWRFSEFGDQLLNQFGRNNSPLVSDKIISLDIDNSSGEILITQETAAFTYRSAAVAPFEELETLKIFPNPVRPEFSGELSIEGLTDYAQVKITSAAGRVVFSAQVRGGRATWNLRTLQGDRVKSGVYLVYVADESGREKISGKFVVI
ncbi:T9SS type A sorting domain-containing protein [Arthrospiribacter ruber]|uniref:T9SS C-terminal target domain-containing protein n=1 Tax=Arthrospiribacter ruber TaxID=2487934 RepID=A0A951MC55_9BACT|nr:T9SS type A sorting domain-containing protein [Arthrospiribacter ruber]MBW3467604.1 T9SS C-terminal target domain-containing protein [Arthrospiribacter ruber]